MINQRVIVFSKPSKWDNCIIVLFKNYMSINSLFIDWLYKGFVFLIRDQFSYFIRSFIIYCVLYFLFGFCLVLFMFIDSQTIGIKINYNKVIYRHWKAWDKS